MHLVFSIIYFSLSLEGHQLHDPSIMRPKQTNDNKNKSSDEDVDAFFVGRDNVSDYNPEKILPELPDIIEEIRDWAAKCMRYCQKRIPRVHSLEPRALLRD
jgi:hypothetical protein